jgi:hypothetical protein
MNPEIKNVLLEIQKEIDSKIDYYDDLRRECRNSNDTFMSANFKAVIQGFEISKTIVNKKING